MRVLLRERLTFDVASGGTTHAPLVMASVGGSADARYVLDTGSDVHVLNEDLADELGLAKDPGEEGTDHGGTTMPSWSVGDVPAAIAGLELRLRNVVAIPAPPPFPGFGIRGILSPQNLHPSAWAVMDLVADELHLVDGTDEEVADFLTAKNPTLTLLRLRRHESAGQLVIQASIDGFDEVPTLLDTGGKKTEFSSAAVPGLVPDEVVRLGGGVSGVDYFGGSVDARALVVDGHRVPMKEIHVRESMSGPGGLIGMDVLGGTVIAAAADATRPVLWQI